MDPLELPHSSKSIKGEYSDSLDGRTIALGVTGSAAAYRAVDLARSLMRRGAEVLVVMSDEATKLVTPELFEWATGNRTITHRFTGLDLHVDLARAADAFVIAPATANTISKIASGVGDTPVTLLAHAFLGSGKPVLVVPAMHIDLFNSPTLQRALKEMSELGVYVLSPHVAGDRVRFPPEDMIAWKLEVLLHSGEDLKGLKVLVTAGPTREHLDPVRYISNPSSGKMGVYLATECSLRGARVTLIHGPLSVSIPYVIDKTVAVTSTSEMLKAVMRELQADHYDLVFMAAAPADFRPAEFSASKLDSSEGLSLRLVPTEKILSEVANRVRDRSVVVGFVAETVESDEELFRRALEKLRKYDVHMVVANNVLRKDVGFASDYNEVLLVTKDGRKQHIEKRRKEYVARLVVDVAKLIYASKPS